jgi:hypothetical protein
MQGDLCQHRHLSMCLLASVLSLAGQWVLIRRAARVMGWQVHPGDPPSPRPTEKLMTQPLSIMMRTFLALAALVELVAASPIYKLDYKLPCSSTVIHLFFIFLTRKHAARLSLCGKNGRVCNGEDGHGLFLLGGLPVPGFPVRRA